MNACISFRRYLGGTAGVDKIASNSRDAIGLEAYSSSCSTDCDKRLEGDQLFSLKTGDLADLSRTA